MKVSTTVEVDKRLYTMTGKLGGPEAQRAAARGLNEHAEEQKRQSIVSIVSSTGVPRSRVAGKMYIDRATVGPSMTASVVAKDEAVMLHEYGSPVWNRAMPGAEATMNRTKSYKGTFMAKGMVMTRVSGDRYPLKVLGHTNPARELAHSDRPNVPGRVAFAKIDLQKRVTRHLLRSIGV